MSRPVRLPAELYEEVAALAAAENRSLANMVRQLLNEALQARAIEAVVEQSVEEDDFRDGPIAPNEEAIKSDFKKGKR
jgi:hypothetical protein